PKAADKPPMPPPAMSTCFFIAVHPRGEIATHATHAIRAGPAGAACATLQRCVQGCGVAGWMETQRRCVARMGVEPLGTEQLRAQRSVSITA
ncbi:MAG: hypothetical protein K2Q97_09205, partial [Burkholderiaceae bacterium]|nr:hypothetical protein [Burkholderiaceae bacterium]